MRIVLYKPMIFASGMTSEQAHAALIAAVNSPAAEFFTFSWASGPECNEHELHGHPKKNSKKFIANPTDFLIEVE